MTNTFYGLRSFRKFYLTKLNSVARSSKAFNLKFGLLVWWEAQFVSMGFDG